MSLKIRNHLLPRMIIKRWEEKNGKIYEKETDTIREINKYDYSKKYYYSLGEKNDELENRISLFESHVGKLLNVLNESKESVDLTEKDMEILKLYVVLQSCRNDNTSPVIISDESGLYENNNYIFGVPLVSTQEDAVKITSLICDEFDRIKKIEATSKYSYDYHIIKNFAELNSYIVWGLHLVIVSSKNNEFLVSETTSVIEISMDNNFMFTFVPVSPKIGLVLAKSKYFYDNTQIKKTLIRFGNKYGNGFPDSELSNVISDNKLVFNGIVENKIVKLKYVELNETEIYNMNSIIYEDGENVLFSNFESLKKSKNANKCRKIIVNF